MIGSTKEFWETAYCRNIGKMIGVCYRYTANRQLSEDLAHDAFLKAIDKSATFEGKGSFDAWLRRIVVNHALQYLRDQKKKKSFDSWMQHESRTVQVEDTNSDTDPIKQIDFSEKELLDTINDLPEHHRLVFNLYVMDKLTHAQIGEELGISSGTSKSHLARARKKIKQLLAQRAEIKRDKRNRKRGFLLFLLPFRLGDIDRLYQQQFSNFEIAPKKALSSDSFESSEASVPKTESSAFTSHHYIVAAASVGIILSVVFFALNSSQREDGSIAQFSTNLDKSKNPELVQKSSEGISSHETIERAETTEALKNNSSASDSNTATIFQDSIILSENKKDKSMKKLNPLAAALIVSSSIISDSVAQSDYKKDFPEKTETRELAEKSPPTRFINVSAPEKPDITVKEESGTFSASRLFWSEENNEVYLRGKVSVDFVDNNFRGTGSFTFLGAVQLLVFNDEPATLDATIKLSKHSYQLTRLDSKKATQKYGEKGQQGAIEISAIE